MKKNFSGLIMFWMGSCLASIDPGDVMPFPQESTSSSTNLSRRINLEDWQFSNQQITFTADNYQKISANRSIRQITINQEKGKLEHINWFLETNPNTEYSYFDGKYTLAYAYNTPFTLNFESHSKVSWIKTTGKVTVAGQPIERENEILDECNASSGIFTTLKQKESFTIQYLQKYFNKPKIKSPKESMEICCRYKEKNSWNEYKTDVFTFLEGRDKNNEKGDIGETCLDNLMMYFGFTKMNGKCGSNNGFDGLYQKGDFIVAAEVKFYKDSPSLDKISRDHLRSKFDATTSGKGAILKINDRSRQQIIRAYEGGKLYLLPFGLQKNGTFYSRLDLAEDLPLNKLMATPGKEIFQPSRTLLISPDSPSEEKEKFIQEKINHIFKESSLNENEFLEIMQTVINKKKNPESILPVLEASSSSLSPSLSDARTLLSASSELIASHNVLLTPTASSSITPSENKRIPLTTSAIPSRTEVQQQQIQYTNENLPELLDALVQKGYSKKDITQMAGYSGSNGLRDFDNMKKNKDNKRWENLKQALEKKQISINDLLQK